jgi:hypothetical protein
MVEEKDVRNMGHFWSSIGLFYLVIALIVGIWIFYQDVNNVIVEKHITSAFNHLLYMSIIIMIIGVMGVLWSVGIGKGIHKISNSKFRSAQASGVLLALGAILTFIMESIEIEWGALFGYVLFFIGLLMVAIGFTMFSKV